MKSVMHIVGKAIWFITALASVGLGIIPFGYNVFAMIDMRVGMSAMAVIYYAIGIAGLISLALMVKACSCCSGCDKSSGNCSCH